MDGLYDWQPEIVFPTVTIQLQQECNIDVECTPLLNRILEVQLSSLELDTDYTYSTFPWFSLKFENKFRHSISS